MRRTCVAVLFLLFSLPAQATTNIGVILDSARAASGVIGNAGGTLTATAANGTVFTLTIPANALANDETITMTPVAQTTNLPFAAGMIAAVQLEPRGLRLFKMATLTIATPTPIPPGVETPLAWHRDGSDLYLHPLFRDPKSITFKLMHFSGAGVANGTDAERQAQINRLPCDLDAALQQKLMPIVLAERQRQLAGLPPEGDVNEQLVEVLTDYYNFSIRPMMAIALQSNDDDILYSAILRAVDTVRQLALWLGDNDPFLTSATSELTSFIVQALQIWSDNAFDRCTREHKIEEMKTLMIAERVAQLLGVSVDLRTNQKLEQCGSMELDFETTIVHGYFLQGEGFQETLHATAIVPIHVKLEVSEPGTAVASAPLLYSYKAVLSATDCTLSNVSNTNDTFAILDMKLNLNPKKPEDVCKSRHHAAAHAIATPEDEPATPPIELVSMTIDPGHPTDTWSVTCPDGTVTTPLHDVFVSLFETFHLAEEEGTQRYKIQNWAAGTGELLLQKDYNQDLSMLGATLTEVSTLKLFHRPGPAP